MTSPRLLLLALLLTVLTVLTVATGRGALTAPGAVNAVGPRRAPPAAHAAARREPAPAPAVAPLRAPSDAAALAVLRGWDRRRAAAWAAGDGAALRALYVPGSAAGRRDVGMLGDWTSRGLRVRGLAMQVLRARVRVHRARRVVLAVTDRVARAVAAGDGVRRSLPRDGASRRTVELVRSSGRWRVATVRPRDG